MNKVTLLDLKTFPIAHTDIGDLVYGPEGPSKEFLVEGVITKARAGLFFIAIDDGCFTTHKNSKFEVGEKVLCVIKPKICDSKVTDFIISGLEKIEK